MTARYDPKRSTGLRHPDHDARLAKIRQLCEDGYTLTEIGDAIGITRERVRQLRNQALAGDAKPKRYRTNLDPLLVVALARKARSISDLRKRVGISSVAPLWKMLDELGMAPALKRLWRMRDKRGGRKWTPSSALAGLVALAEQLGRTPGVNDVMAASREIVPAHSFYFKAFGSMLEAQRLAGLALNAKGSRGHRPGCTCGNHVSRLLP